MCSVCLPTGNLITFALLRVPTGAPLNVMSPQLPLMISLIDPIRTIAFRVSLISIGWPITRSIFSRTGS